MDRQYADEETAEMGRKIIHHGGPGLLGWSTLCGHVDCTDYRWKYTKAKANCAGCFAVIKHVAALQPQSNGE